ncbi:UDP-N-acetylmuramoyl-L-alanine--D-glutamate ligase [Persicitalea jodogahamensis]|uniref:UDP-N-acetylmuramoylalanine--D-glutamate ligase n=1 Tax=Persicitalea jodogahamensis TaxID=402147 RepID=A0A8J3D795_9BACT|nr:UDP-N-acetylmuramoyl-L-alanine--D-glutamate ligase [Persicitalea jodogahamensis]GHB71405.1 UDP-N-acetylmuramoylalanine--D-glutamate ligase [Persicitalea jodogahamensis]
MSAASRKLVILGGGESGVGAALLGKSRGFEVFLSDRSPLQTTYREVLNTARIPFEEGAHTEGKILEANEVVKSPGISDTAHIVQELYRRNIPVISEIEFAARYTDARLIAITGSNGKTTTTLLIYHLLREAGLSVGLAGNVGASFAAQVASDQKDFYVLEISSFQLDNMYDFRANVAVLLNITPDHLDRYDYDFQKYVQSKFRIVQNQTGDDDFIYFAESKALTTELEKRTLPARLWPISLENKLVKGGYLADGVLTVRGHDQDFSIPSEDLPIQGPHNAINALAAILAAQSVGISAEQIRSGLRSFVNAPHRLESIITLEGVEYVNDSKATNVDSVYYALGSFNRPIVLIIGGVDKGNDYAQIEPLVKEKVKGIIALGTDTKKLADYFIGAVPQFHETQSLEEAVRTARAWAAPGDVVLLSPACASFDLFKNYLDRGDQFRNEVLALKPTPIEVNTK